jgi:pilus assembly protein CpaE
MHTVVACDNVSHPSGGQLRDLVQHHLHPQGPTLIPLDQLPGYLLHGRPELVFLVLAPDPERALAELQTLRPLVHGRILAVGPAESGLILRVLHAGADHYLDEADLAHQFTALLPRLRGPAQPEVPLGRLVAVLGAGGGSGASMVAANVAVELAKSPGGCGLIDLRAGPGDLAALLNLKPTFTLADLCLNLARMDQAMFESSLVRHESGVALLGPPARFGDAHLLTPSGVWKALTLAREKFPCVVADLEDCHHEEQVLSLRQADVILLVLRLEFTSLRRARRILDHLDDLDLPRDRVRLVVNRYGQAKELAVAEAEEALGRKVAHYLPDDPRTVNLANNLGVPVVVKAPRTKIAHALAQVARDAAPPAPAADAPARSATPTPVPGTTGRLVLASLALGLAGLAGR